MSPAPASNQRRVLPHIKLSRRNVTRLVRPGDRPLRLDLRCLGVKAAREEESILHLRAWPVPRVEPPMAGTSVLAPTKETSRRLGEPARAGLVQQADLEGLVERARALAVKRDNLYIADERRLLPINNRCRARASNSGFWLQWPVVRAANWQMPADGGQTRQMLVAPNQGR
jgi:hypothetical protein